jgi:hypothetical protein
MYAHSRILLYAFRSDSRTFRAWPPTKAGGINWFNNRGSDDTTRIGIAPTRSILSAACEGVFLRALAPTENFNVANTLVREMYVQPIFAEAHRLELGALPQLLSRDAIVAVLGHVRVGDQRIPEVVVAHRGEPPCEARAIERTAIEPSERNRNLAIATRRHALDSGSDVLEM